MAEAEAVLCLPCARVGSSVIATHYVLVTRDQRPTFTCAECASAFDVLVALGADEAALIAYILGER